MRAYRLAASPLARTSAPDFDLSEESMTDLAETETDSSYTPPAVPGPR
ncbi:MAG TPA: hypothetical protein VMY88_01220 [Acidimicrobiales bacterium]|nr:hypothetical protein [Acidimicrobiales bacterium]